MGNFDVRRGTNPSPKKSLQRKRRGIKRSIERKGRNKGLAKGFWRGKKE